jgi:hypothetical protein
MKKACTKGGDMRYPYKAVYGSSYIQVVEAMADNVVNSFSYLPNNILRHSHIHFPDKSFRYISPVLWRTILSALTEPDLPPFSKDFPGDEIRVGKDRHNVVRIYELPSEGLLAEEISAPVSDQRGGAVRHESRFPWLFESKTLWLFRTWFIVHSPYNSEPLKATIQEELALSPEDVKSLLKADERKIQAGGVSGEAFYNGLALRKPGQPPMFIPWDAVYTLKELLEQT